MSAQLYFTPSVLGNRGLPIEEVYTGTKDQPDVVSIFFKSRDSNIHITDEQILNGLGHTPIGWRTAVRRIENALKMLFLEWKEGRVFAKNTEALNAVKNLLRGAVQLVPLLGNAVLYGYDWVKIHLFLHPKIKWELSHQKGSVIGMAFDGKVLFTVPSSLNKNANPKRKLAFVKYAWLELLNRVHENNASCTRHELAKPMHQVLLTHRF